MTKREVDVYECHRCGATTQAPRGENPEEYWGRLDYRESPQAVQVDKVHLCPDCHGAFGNFLGARLE